MNGQKEYAKSQRQAAAIAVIRNHLSGTIVMGVYPLLQNETCHFLAVDFDKEAWKEDAKAFAETCKLEGITAALERSRSGNGAHVWIFFDSPVPAAKARKLGTFLMTRTLDRRPEIGLDSFDRFFPNQDTMPKGGFGNLIALPLQKEARAKNSASILSLINRVISTQLQRNSLLFINSYIFYSP